MIQYDSCKRSRSFYTDEKLKILNKNMMEFDWAKQEKERVVKAADMYLQVGVDFLLTYVTQQNLPRSYSVNEMKGCPVCGREVDRFGNYPYLADPLNRPFKLMCPACLNVFPSNDFNSYYKSGLDETGCFRYEKADPKYLINELYPDKPSDWCVDSGYGWVDPEGIKNKSYSIVHDGRLGKIRKETTIGDNRFTFIAYFNHWFVWTHDFMYENTMGLVTTAICAFRDAYLYTGDKVYADTGLVLLNRVADFYPEFDACVYKWEDNFRHSGGAWGKIIGSIWEGNIVDNLAKAYDAFFPAIDEQSVSEIAERLFYRNNPLKPKYPDHIKRNIENNLLRQILPEVKNRRIRGNVGMHQSSIALAALVLQNEDYFDLSIDYILSTTDRQAWGTGNILRILTDQIDHDGCGTETSIGYNGIWLNGLNKIAEMLKGTPKDLYLHPKFIKMFRLDEPVLVANRYTLNIGDSGMAGSPLTVIHESPLLTHFEQTNDILSAQLLNLAAKNRDDVDCGRRGKPDLFTDHKKLEKEIEKIIKRYGPYRSKSKTYTGYGLSKIDVGNDKNPKSLWMYFGRNTGHGHRDTLMIGIFAYGAYLNPDHGYPALTDGNHEEMKWTKNTSSHDTVMVDNRPGKDQIVGIPKHFHAGRFVSVIDIKAPLIYPQTSCYRRTMVVVHRENIFYSVDFFRVFQGNDHKYFFHGAEGEVTVTGLNLTKQKSGTFAGENVEYSSVEYDETHDDGFNYLYDVQRDDNIVKPYAVDWKIKDTWGVWDDKKDVHLALHMLEPTEKAALAKGKPPQNKPGNPKEFTYLIAGNTGDNISSCFTALIDVYEGKSEIVQAESVSIIKKAGQDVNANARAVKVIDKNGRTDYIINSIDNNTYFVDGKIEFKGFLAVISFKDDKVVYCYGNDTDFCRFNGKNLISQNKAVTGCVKDFTKEMSEQNYITITLDREVCPKTLDGKYIDIKTDGIRNGFYEIVSALKIKQNQYLINIGDVTLIRGFIDPEDFALGYKYNIEKGAEVRIALPEENFFE